MSCPYCRKDGDECAVDHDEDLFDPDTHRRRIQARRPIAYTYGPPPAPEKGKR